VASNGVLGARFGKTIVCSISEKGKLRRNPRIVPPQGNNLKKGKMGERGKKRLTTRSGKSEDRNKLQKILAHPMFQMGCLKKKIGARRARRGNGALKKGKGVFRKKVLHHGRGREGGEERTKFSLLCHAKTGSLKKLKKVCGRGERKCTNKARRKGK